MKIFQLGLADQEAGRLSAAGFLVLTDPVVQSPQDLKEYLEYEACEAILLDLDTVPWGAFALRYLRQQEIRTPVIGFRGDTVLGSWSDERAQFLENGGNDLLRHPIHIRELAASLRAISRLYDSKLLQDALTFKWDAHDVTIDLAANKAYVDGAIMPLTHYEYRLLTLLATRSGSLVSRDDINEWMYEHDNASVSNSIEVMMSRIRKKFDALGVNAEGMIETVRGGGYRLNVPCALAA
jgi:two-component system response regulator PhoP